MKCEFWIRNFLFLVFYLHHEAEHTAGAGTPSLPNSNRCQNPRPKASAVPGTPRRTGKAWRETAWGPRDWCSFQRQKINTTKIQTHKKQMLLQSPFIYTYTGNKTLPLPVQSESLLEIPAVRVVWSVIKTKQAENPGNLIITNTHAETEREE